ncbi:MAG TPA: LacI family DNA-binding transcriptional regulator [Pseudonocardiaceae bacterium]
MTIHEVARAAGVSPSTVSNLLNGRADRMHPATRARVESAIARLGYRPNRAARQLRTGRIQVIGLVVPSVGNPFWGGMARALEVAALAGGYHVLLCNSERDPDRERRYLEALYHDGIRGVVLGSSLPSLEHITPMIENGLHVVAFDRVAQPTDPSALINIGVDNAAGAEAATEHVIGLGHRRLAFVSGSLASVNRQERFRGFQAAVTRSGIPASDVTVWRGADNPDFGDVRAAELGRAAARELLDGPRPPTAVVAVNDMCAIGACRGIRDAGLRVPDDVSVTGFDDILLAELYDPPLTTVRQPLTDMATHTFARLRARIERDPDLAPDPAPARPTLMVRASTAPPPPHGQRR